VVCLQNLNLSRPLRISAGPRQTQVAGWTAKMEGLPGLLAWTRGRPTATGVGSLSYHTTSHAHNYIPLARVSAPYSLPRPLNGNFAHASRSDGPRNLLELQALHPAQPSALVLYCSDFTFTLLHTGWILATQPARNALPRQDLSFRLYVAAITLTPPCPTHLHPAHARTHRVWFVTADKPPASPGAQQAYLL